MKIPQTKTEKHDSAYHYNIHHQNIKHNSAESITDNTSDYDSKIKYEQHTAQ